MKRTFKDEELKPIMVSLLETLIGFEIGLFDMLCMYQLEDGRFAVYNQTDCYKSLSEADEYLFEKAPDAVDLFLKLRHDRQLGFDHEGGWVKQLEEDLRPEYDFSKLKPVSEEIRQKHWLRHHSYGEG
jgi:hypothetical protein